MPMQRYGPGPDAPSPTPSPQPTVPLRPMMLLLAAILAVQILALVLPLAGLLRTTYGEKCDEVRGDRVYDFEGRLCEAPFGTSSFRVPHDADWGDPATEMYHPSFSGDWVLRDEDE